MRNLDWTRARRAHGTELGLTRREQLTGTFSAFVTVMLAAEVSVAQPQRRMAARDWSQRQDELGRALRRGQLSPDAWMTEVERLAREIDVSELLPTPQWSN